MGRLLLGRDYLLAFDVNYLWYVLVLFEISAFMFLLKKHVLCTSFRKQMVCLFAFFCVSVFQFLIGAELPLQLDRAIRYSFWFYLGMLLEYHRGTIKNYATTRNVIFAVIVWLAGYALHTWFENIIEQGNFGGNGGLLIGIKGVKMLVRYTMMEIGGSMMIILLAFRINKISSRCLKLIGDQSFTIYLYHCPCIWVMKQVIMSVVPAQQMSNILYVFLICLLPVWGIVSSLLIDQAIRGIKIRITSVKQLK